MFRISRLLSYIEVNGSRSRSREQKTTTSVYHVRGWSVHGWSRFDWSLVAVVLKRLMNLLTYLLTYFLPIRPCEGFNVCYNSSARWGACLLYRPICLSSHQRTLHRHIAFAVRVYPSSKRLTVIVCAFGGHWRQQTANIETRRSVSDILRRSVNR